MTRLCGFFTLALALVALLEAPPAQAQDKGVRGLFDDPKEEKAKEEGSTEEQERDEIQGEEEGDPRPRDRTGMNVRFWTI